MSLPHNPKDKNLSWLKIQSNQQPVDDYVGKNLNGTNFSGQDLTGCSFDNAALNGSNMSCTLLNGASFRETQLRGSDLSKAKLCGANLSDVDLEGADLRHADLSGAYLHRANLCNTNLYGADLDGADVTGARFQGSFGINQDDLKKLKEKGADIGDLQSKRKSWDSNFSKWLLQYVIIPILIALIGSGGIISILKWLRNYNTSPVPTKTSKPSIKSAKLPHIT